MNTSNVFWPHPKTLPFWSVPWWRFVQNHSYSGQEVLHKNPLLCAAKISVLLYKRTTFPEVIATKATVLRFNNEK